MKRFVCRMPRPPASADDALQVDDTPIRRGQQRQDVAPHGLERKGFILDHIAID
jgi:hypothetical protein